MALSTAPTLSTLMTCTLLTLLLMGAMLGIAPNDLLANLLL
ncbi:hypothetical protein CZ787_13130 [Halomonas citrativorans]|uniref:Uncharacterized protein n=1 Tax=Halomonas citrativorans TaxID=2742612 RepID=A0A1R4I2T8_9GAMM|nr:hypothetical protein CZ787_13130 [Halomonas citrativorans]